MAIRSLLLLTALLAAPAVLGTEAGFAWPMPDGEATLLPTEGDSAWSNGRWTLGPAAAHLSAGSQKSPGTLYLVPRSPAGAVESGLIRLRVTTEGGRHDFSLLFRFSPGPHPETFQAFGASVEGNQFLLHRWDDGQPAELGPRVDVPGLTRRPQLELTLMLAGPHLMVQLHDAKSLEPLATLTATDPTLTTGHVGVRVEPKAAPLTRFEGLSVVGSAQGGSGGASPREVVNAATLAPSRRRHAPVGPKRLVTVRRSTLTRLPEEFAEAVLEPLPGDTPDAAQLLLPGPVSLERCRRAGVEVVEVHPSYGWIHLHRGYRHQVAVAGTEGPYRDAAMVERRLKVLHESRPALTRLVELGRSHQGRPLWGLRVTRDPDGPVDRPAVLLAGAHHGDELLALEMAMDALERLLERPESDPLFDRLDFWAVPLVNPDGNVRFTRSNLHEGRKNGRDLNGDGRFTPHEGVDLNRNYPFRWGGLGEGGSRSWPMSTTYRGDEAASEPEIRTMVRLANEQHFVAALSWHTAAGALLTPYTDPSARPPEPNLARSLADRILKGGKRTPNGRRFRVLPRLYPVDGTDQDWLAHAHGTIALMLEGPLNNPLETERAVAAVQSARFVFDRFLKLVDDAPRLSLRVADVTGRPLAAEVHVGGIRTFNGERWSARARDGRFELMAPGDGPYEVTASLEGFETATVTARTGRLSTITLRPARR